MEKIIIIFSLCKKYTCTHCLYIKEGDSGGRHVILNSAQLPGNLHYILGILAYSSSSLMTTKYTLSYKFHILIYIRKEKKENLRFLLNTLSNIITKTFKYRLCFRPQVSGIPTVLGIKNGKVVDRFTGLIEKEELRQFVEKLFK